MLGLLTPTGFVESSGYLAIFLLSVLQSCCVPTSSELTLGFGGVLAAEGKLSLPGVIIAGASGEVVGAFIAWIIGRAGARRFVDRYGKYVLLSHHDLDRAEAWYQRHERWGVFGSRLLPVIRNFVALPAGAAEVPWLRFGLLTAAGSLLWDGAMAGIGYAVGSSWRSVMHRFSEVGYVLAVLALAALGLAIYHRYRSYRAATAGTSAMSGAHRIGAHAQRPDPSSGPRQSASGPAGTVAVPSADAASGSEVSASGSGTGSRRRLGQDARISRRPRP